MKKLSRNQRRARIHARVRTKVSGAADLPRLGVFRSLKHTYAHLVNDQDGRVLAAASTLNVDGKKLKNGSNVAAAKVVGKQIAELAKKNGVEKVVFDRSGYIYHGRVKALADAAREAGLKF